MIDIRQGDCLELLRALPDGSVDAVVTDPPYNVGCEYDGYKDRRDDYRDWCAAWLTELKRVCNGPILISCGVGNLGVWHSIEPPRWVLSWWKPASAGRCVVGFNNWEPILYYGKGITGRCDVIRTTEQAALPVMSKKRPINHPCPKPVEWAAKQVQIATAEGETVLDCFGGSGSTAVACVQEGRSCVLIEQSPKYAGIARRRVAEAEANLFAEAV